MMDYDTFERLTALFSQLSAKLIEEDLIITENAWHYADNTKREHWAEQIYAIT